MKQELSTQKSESPISFEMRRILSPCGAMTAASALGGDAHGDKNVEIEGGIAKFNPSSSLIRVDFHCITDNTEYGV